MDDLKKKSFQVDKILTTDIKRKEYKFGFFLQKKSFASINIDVWEWIMAIIISILWSPLFKPLIEHHYDDDYVFCLFDRNIGTLIYKNIHWI